jgi:hypothetical protein
MRDLGLTLFDTYIWRYYRSGGFRPFGKRPFQAMNVHTYILVFHKPNGEELDKKNSEVKYRKRLIEKKVKEVCGENPYKFEGKQGDKWIIVDYVQVVVHCMMPEARHSYNLEELWSDAEQKEHLI